MAEYKVTRQLAPEEAAYLAGLIDGEGTITLTRRQKNAERSLVITIANTELPLLTYPLAIIGSGRITSKRTFKSNHSPSWVYYVCGRQALDLLKQIEPFLKSYKKQRAKLVLNDYVRLTPRNGRYSEALLKERCEFVENFFSLTSNGNSPRKRAVPTGGGGE